MRLILILTRHAKSDWADPGLGDHDRPLSPRGRAAAPRIGAHLARNGWVPCGVLCSTARRTRDTWTGMAGQFDGSPEPALHRALYGAAPEGILAAVRHAAGSPLMVIGHNPGIGALARLLAAAPPRHGKFGLYPTGATTVLEFAAPAWDGIAPGRGKVLDFIVPRALPDPERAGPGARAADRRLNAPGFD